MAHKSMWLQLEIYCIPADTASQKNDNICGYMR